MSAFVVSYEHINAILHWYRVTQHRLHYNLSAKGKIFGGWSEADAWIKAAEVLFAENARSVAFRYQVDPEEFDPSQVNVDLFSIKPLEPVEVLSAIECYLYQCCETNDWQETLAFALASKIKSAAIGALPGYSKAAWSIKDARFSAIPKPLSA